MNNKKISRIIFLILVIQFFSACKSIPGKKEKIELNGMVYDTQNRPVVNYQIIIDGKYICTSDIGGRFLIKGIEKGEHIFSGYGEGYLNIEEKIVVYDKAQILYLRIPSVESKFREAFELIKNSNLDKAEIIINEIRESDVDNEDVLYFMDVIKELRARNEKK